MTMAKASPLSGWDILRVACGKELPVMLALCRNADTDLGEEEPGNGMTIIPILDHHSY